VWRVEHEHARLLGHHELPALVDHSFDVLREQQPARLPSTSRSATAAGSPISPSHVSSTRTVAGSSAVSASGDGCKERRFKAFAGVAFGVLVARRLGI